MYFSRKIFPIAPLIVSGICGNTAASADSYIYIREHPIYSKGTETRVLDEAAARRFLTGLPDINVKDIWFATGGEEYLKSPTCITGGGVWVYTKPEVSSPGLYRGRVSYFEESEDTDKPTCGELRKHFVLSVPVASFIDPDAMHPEEAFDGQVPGIFHVDGEISDQQLMQLADSISKIRACLKSGTICAFSINGSALNHPDYDLDPKLKVENLTQVDSRTYKDGTVHYEIYFSGGSALKWPRAIDIACKDGTIVDVRTDLEVTE